tara:strand:+ start:708 stop:1046 length:339 start_codon:yes stop_codon:yes gene_type:complete
MTSRYAGTSIGINDLEQYELILKEKGVQFIRQYFSPNLVHPTAQEVRELELVGHTWSLGDRFYKLAYKYYGDSTLWWVIAWYNQTPTEAQVQIGDTLQIPLPLDKILRMLGV